MLITVESDFSNFGNETLFKSKQRIEEAILKYGENSVLNISSYEEYGDMYTSIVIEHKREETKEEEERRIGNEQRNSRRSLEYERKQYEALKKKFG